jgi:hypothetical protein
MFGDIDLVQLPSSTLKQFAFQVFRVLVGIENVHSFCVADAEFDRTPLSEEKTKFLKS